MRIACWYQQLGTQQDNSGIGSESKTIPNAIGYICSNIDDLVSLTTEYGQRRSRNGIRMVTSCSRQLAQCLPNEVDWMERSRNRRREVRVLLVDHSELVLHGLKATLSTLRHIVVVGTATTQDEAFASLKTCEVDVVVMDIQVGSSSGIEICRAIRESDPQVAVLFFTANDDKRLLRAAILAGAQGYLLKKASSEAIAKAIETVAARRAIVDQHLIQDILHWMRAHTSPLQRNRARSPSESDMRVLSLIAEGKSSKEIAGQLNVTPGVLKARLRGIYRRLNISRRSEAASYFVRWEQGAL
jgi:two-component system, NarL family, response regulator DevR